MIYRFGKASAAAAGMPHNRTVASALDDAASRPSGENATPVTAPVCPSNLCNKLLWGMSHRRIVLSAPADRKRLPSGENATPSTAQLARGLDRSGIGHWQHYRAALEPVLPLLEPWVGRLAR